MYVLHRLEEADIIFLHNIFRLNLMTFDPNAESSFIKQPLDFTITSVT